jgi:lactate dehydrogenase-like 2-hydroxyacid dehydrogenase
VQFEPGLKGASLVEAVRAGAGYNIVDVKTASEPGIDVANFPGKNAVAVAETALGLVPSTGASPTTRPTRRPARSR